MIDLGVIGYGRAGEAHARCYDTMPETRIAAVIDPTAARRDAAHTHFPNALVAATLDDLDLSIDLALICTPVSSHEAYTERMLRRGVHVFCEKPAFLDPENGARLIALARERRRLIYPGHNYTHSPLLRRLRVLGAPERIGRLRRLDMRIERTTSASGSADWNPSWRREPTISGGGILVDHGPHCIYLAEWLAREQIRTVRCTMEYVAPQVEDHVELALGLSGGVEAHITLTWRAPRRRNTYRLTGADGTVVLDDDALVQASPAERRTWPLAEPPWGHHAHDAWLPALAHDVLRQTSTTPARKEPAHSALVVARTIAAAYASASHGGRSVALATGSQLARRRA